MVARRIAEGELGRQRIRRGVDAVDEVTGAAVRRRSADQIRPLVRTAGIRTVRAYGDIDRRAALDRGHAADLPAAQDVPKDRLLRVPEDGYLVEIAGDEPVRKAPVRRGVITPDVEVIHRPAARVRVGAHVVVAGEGVVHARLQPWLMRRRRWTVNAS